MLTQYHRPSLFTCSSVGCFSTIIYKSIIKCYLAAENRMQNTHFYMKLMNFNCELLNISRKEIHWIITWQLDVNFSKWIVSYLLKEQRYQNFLKLDRMIDLNLIWIFQKLTVFLLNTERPFCLQQILLSLALRVLIYHRCEGTCVH